VLLDGRDVSEFKISGLREQIGFVLQDTMLFYGTIKENILYGRPCAGEEEIMAAARLANVDDFVVKLPKRYDTLIGERGITLSGGEKQRIGIARAILKNAPILILDEPTASLDSESEKIVLKALENLMQGKTVITISHKLNTIIHADRIIVIKEGVITGQGKHEELLRSNPFYCDLFRWYQNNIDVKPTHQV
jgi:subfamily B ATP-binding cassette protein MsbA